MTSCDDAITTLHYRKNPKNSSMSGLIWVCTFCQGLSVRKFRIIMVMAKSRLFAAKIAIECDFSVYEKIETWIHDPVLMSVLNSWKKQHPSPPQKRIGCRQSLASDLFLETCSSINSIIHEHSCKILFFLHTLSWTVTLSRLMTKPSKWLCAQRRLRSTHTQRNTKSLWLS